MNDDYNQQDIIYSLEAEQAVLSGLLKEQGGWDKVGGILTGESFYYKPHKVIFEAMMHLFNAGIDTNVLNTKLRLKDFSQLEEVGVDYLDSLYGHALSTANIGSYIGVLHDMHMRRGIVSLCQRMSNLALSPKDMKASDILDEYHTALYKLASTGHVGEECYSMRDLIASVLDHIENARSGKIDRGISSGYPDLDALVKGFRADNLVIIGARPAVGKTTFAINLAVNAILKDIPVVFMSLEVGKADIELKAFSCASGVPYDDLDEGRLTNLRQLSNQIKHYETKPFEFCVSARSISRIKALVKKYAMAFHAKGQKLGIVIIDHLQIIEGPGETRLQQLTEISRALKVLAQDLQLTVIALSQLNRTSASRIDKRPLLSDLRESGSIEQDADIVMFLHRDDYQNSSSADRGIAEVIVAKNRNGSTGTAKLLFKPHINCFRSITNY